MLLTKSTCNRTALECCRKAGVSPFWSPIRGGTDGARLTASGLPTPNMFTGSGNHHSVTEWLSVDALQKAVETIVNFERWQLIIKGLISDDSPHSVPMFLS